MNNMSSGYIGLNLWNGTDYTDNNHKHQPIAMPSVSPGVLVPPLGNAVTSQFENSDQQKKEHNLISPPKTIAMVRGITEKQVNATFESIRNKLESLFFSKSNSSSNGASNGPNFGSEGDNTNGIDNSDMQNISTAITLLTVGIETNLGLEKANGEKSITKGEEKTRLYQIQKQDEAGKKAIEAENKAKKANIWTAVIDWVTSVAEIVAGVAQIAAAVLSGGAYATGFSGGVTNIIAGTAGIGKAVCDTMAAMSNDPAVIKNLQALGAKFGNVQMAFEALNAVVCFISVGRGIMAARAALSGVMKGVAEGAAKALADAAKVAGSIAGKEALEQGIKEIASNLAKEITDKVMVAVKEAADVGIKDILKKVAMQILKKFFGSGLGPKIEEGLEDAVTTALKKTIQSLEKKGTEITAESIQKELKKQLTIALGKELYKILTSDTVRNLLVATQASSDAVGKIGTGAIAKERAVLKRDIDKLSADMKYADYIADTLKTAKKDVDKSLKDLSANAQQMMRSGVYTLQQQGVMFSNVASQIA